ncbi:hypothetical protein CDD81_1940 [Ophiocordyceps australis]|uniref:Ribosomal RNA methyltransferase FtsJ domain-containing protein n=1 Tax=Ophiocordyceps australis TaxID=1399860 RepID=A0A2C5XYN3_9HYPO|nr:hypothetical protein CDD81_1940 [Ophiocordyceps australis]
MDDATSNDDNGRLQKQVRDFIVAQSPVYLHLESLRKEGWASAAGDQFFKRQRELTATPNNDYFFKMTKFVGVQMQNQTMAFNVLKKSTEPCALDMGMAPGGFSETMLTLFKKTKVTAITLPESQGGYPTSLQDDNLKLMFYDINDLVGDVGLDHISEMRSSESTVMDKLLGAQVYDVVICGSQATQARKMALEFPARYSERLQLAQLVIAMSHLKDNGTVIAVMHKPENHKTAELLRIFSSIADICLFKPNKVHSKRSSFYMVAKNVKPSSPAAIQALKEWREEWRVATMVSNDPLYCRKEKSVEEVEKMLKEFGDELVRLGNPIWAIQAKALEKAPFMN